MKVVRFIHPEKLDGFDLSGIVCAACIFFIAVSSRASSHGREQVERAAASDVSYALADTAPMLAAVTAASLGPVEESVTPPAEVQVDGHPFQSSQPAVVFVPVFVPVHAQKEAPATPATTEEATEHAPVYERVDATPISTSTPPEPALMSLGALEQAVRASMIGGGIEAGNAAGQDSMGGIEAGNAASTWDAQGLAKGNLAGALSGAARLELP